MNKLLKIHPHDNTATALQALQIGDEVAYSDEKLKNLAIAQSITKMHKVALEDIPAGAAIKKYGQIIGFASQSIRKGEHVHTHNCEMGEVSKDYAISQAYHPWKVLPEAERVGFMGYRRPGGKTGTRNYIGIITSVNCSATVAQQIAQHYNSATFHEEWSNVDGIVALTHSGGCGMRHNDEGYRMLQRTFEGFAKHPNFGGILLVGLGCETMQIEEVMAQSGLHNNAQFQAFTIQQRGGSKQAIAVGISAIDAMLPQVNACNREFSPASDLVMAVQCGGSDAFSGFTANPALGLAADLMVSNGGTVIYSETPEIFGAEHLLTRRAESDAVAQQLLERIAWWQSYTQMHGFDLDNNPSPGNKVGGLTTIMEKSLGAQAKSGNSPLMAVYHYAEPITRSGLVFMDSPGFDPVSVTGQVASGANIVCFTTGRGSAYGCKPVPSIKLCSNSDTFRSMQDDMDINCGLVIDGEQTLQQMGDTIFEQVLAVASGKKTQSEILGYGDAEFNPWKIGAVL